MGNNDAHSVYGPSSAHRWLICPGSVQAEATMPAEKESVFAYEGTCAHELADVCLSTEDNATNWIGKHLPFNKEWVVDQEMANYIQDYIDDVRFIGGVQEYEQEVNYDNWIPGGFGTADVIAIKNDTLYVIDLKYGKGVKVDAPENPQGMLYALGALSEREVFRSFDKVVIIINQPRLNHISTWDTTPGKLYAFGAHVWMCALKTTFKDPERIPGEKQCQWCRAKATCPELQTKTERALMVQFEDMSVKTPRALQQLTEQDLRFVMDNKSLIESWLQSVEIHVKGLIESGHGFPGWKMVAGRSNRKWADDEYAAKTLTTLLGDEAYVKKLLTAPAAEKLLGKEDKKKIQNMIVKPEGKPVLVPEGDKRPALVGITADDFD